MRSTYLINSSRNQIDYGKVSHYMWDSMYKPEMEFSVTFDKEIGFKVRMIAYESEPRRVFAMDGDPVYKDSCMEFFVNFYPEQKDAGYLNFEMNANGCLLLQYGKSRNDRNSVRHLYEGKPIAQINENDWQIEFDIPLSFIDTIYGSKGEFEGKTIRANVYKCGDDTEAVHYGSWSEITLEEPNFHCPEFFGEMMICL